MLSKKRGWDYYNNQEQKETPELLIWGDSLLLPLSCPPSFILLRSHICF